MTTPDGRVRLRRGAALLTALPVLGVVGACTIGGTDAATGTTYEAFDCPETIRDGGNVSGMDLPLPPWLPADLPLPEGLSILHTNRGGAELDVATGYVAGGHREQIIPDLHDALVAAGFETLLFTPGVIPLSTDAIVVLAPEEGRTVRVSAGSDDEGGPIRVGDGRCEWRPGVLVHLGFADADPTEARDLYAESLLELGSAEGNVGGVVYTSPGECFVHDGTYNFAPDQGRVMVDLRVTSATPDAPAFVVGNVTVQDQTTNLLYTLFTGGPSGEPIPTITATGFSARGDLHDAAGDEGLVPGSITVDCGQVPEP